MYPNGTTPPGVRKSKSQRVERVLQTNQGSLTMLYFRKKRFSAGLLSVIFVWVAVSAHAQVTIPNTFTSGTTISSSQVNANFTALKNAVDPLLVSSYFQFGNLNFAPTNITFPRTCTKLATTGTAHTFTKSRADTKIEVHVNSRFFGGTFSGAAGGVVFQVRIDDIPTTLVENLGSIVVTNTSEFLSIYAVFQGLAAGSHTISVCGLTDPGTSSGAVSGVVVDPGGWGGTIIVKEVL